MMACARKNGATHVHTHFSSPDEPIRRAEMTGELYLTTVHQGRG